MYTHTRRAIFFLVRTQSIDRFYKNIEFKNSAISFFEFIQCVFELRTNSFHYCFNNSHKSLTQTHWRDNRNSKTSTQWRTTPQTERRRIQAHKTDWKVEKSILSCVSVEVSRPVVCAAAHRALTERLQGLLQPMPCEMKRLKGEAQQ